MKKTFILFALFFVPSILFSQAILVHMGQSFTGTSSNSGPNGTSSHTYMRGSTLAIASELTTGIPTSTTLTTFGFMINAGASSAVSGNLKVYMLNTTATTYANGSDWATLSAAMTLVYDGLYTIPVSTVPIAADVTLTTPFLYTGGGIYIAYQWTCTSTVATTAAVYQCNTSLTNGLVRANSSTALPATLSTASSYRPCMRLGYNNPYTNDGVVLQVYTLGKLPIPFGTPHAVQAYIKNQGAVTIYNTPATLNIAGANSFTNVKTIDSILAGSQSLVTFDNFVPTSVGANTVTVSIPSDENNTNNSLVKSLETNLNTYSYAQGTIHDGGVGFTSATGDFVAKFTTTSTQAMNQVDVRFSAGGQPFQIGIWSVGTGGTPGTLLYTSPTYTSTSGAYTVLIDPPVTIPVGAFFVGVKQTGTSNVSFAYQSETPIRPNCFFYTSPGGGTTWTDFAPNNAFRFMIEPKFALANDVSINAIAPAASTVMVAGQPITLQATVINYGTNTQATVPVKYSVNGATPVGPVNTTVSIDQNDTNTVFFSGADAFTPSQGGIYTVQLFTALTGDLNAANDTMTVVYNILPAPITTYPYVQNFNDPIGWTTTGSLWFYAGAHSPIEATDLDSAFVANFYSASAGVTGMLKSPIFNLSDVTVPKLEFYVAYRTYTHEDDSLQVWVSFDMGQTFIPGSPLLYSKSYTSNPSLSTLDSNIASFFPEATTDWRLETIDLTQLIGNTSVMFGFKGISANGNNCWVDQVKVYDNVAPTVTTATASNITPYTFTIGGEVTTEGGAAVTERGICYSTSQNPTIADTHTSDGSGTGTFVSDITGLAQNTVYYAKAYATNSIGTGYGEEVMVTTIIDDINDVTNQNIKIYQLDQTLIIETNQPFASGIFQLFDVNGKLVKESKIVDGQIKITENVNDIVKGMYLISLSSGTEKNGYKVIIK
jgi:hypothetical protein